MAYDTKLADRVRSALASRKGIEERTLFGGLTFSINGNMVCSVNSRGFQLRVGTENYEKALKMPNMTPVMLGTKPMNGMVFAGEGAYASEDGLKMVVDMAADVAASLPPKMKKEKKA